MDTDDLYVDVAIVGCVSTGKSTLMNAIFAEQYSDMKVKRTTMVPQIYCECDKPPSASNGLSETYIKDTNKAINDKLSSKVRSSKITSSDIEPMRYYVDKIRNFAELPGSIKYRIHDLPGINDGHTDNDVYYQYIKENFHTYGIILLIVDINTAFNTADEMKLLDTVIRGVKHNLDIGLCTKLGVIANKCDDMCFDNDKLVMDDEMEEMHQQIIDVIDVKRREISYDKDIKIVKLSAEDAFLYRVYQNNPDISLDMKHVNRIGANEIGKHKWNTLSISEKEQRFRDIMKSIDYGSAIKLTGFDNFIDKMSYSTHSVISLALNDMTYKLSKVKRPCYGYNINPEISQFNKWLIVLHKNSQKFLPKYSKYMYHNFDKLLSKFEGEYCDFVENAFRIITTSNYGHVKIAHECLVELEKIGQFYREPDDNYLVETTKYLLQTRMCDYHVNHIKNKSYDYDQITYALKFLSESKYDDNISICKHTAGCHSVYREDHDKIRNLVELMDKLLFFTDEYNKCDFIAEVLLNKYKEMNKFGNISVKKGNSSTYMFKAYEKIRYINENYEHELLEELLYYASLNRKYMRSDTGFDKNTETPLEDMLEEFI